MIKYAENLYQLAIWTERDADFDTAKDYATKCGQILKKVFEFDPENHIASQLRINLYKEFTIEILNI